MPGMFMSIGFFYGAGFLGVVAFFVAGFFAAAFAFDDVAELADAGVASSFRISAWWSAGIAAISASTSFRNAVSLLIRWRMTGSASMRM